ncbi:hypothetical protein L6R52_16805 [Myxococcota bacterium]|nr:hypothetical protein [Myxococcota bacterium]
MGRSFDITLKTEALGLEAGKAGEVGLTVKNASGAPQRAVVRLAAKDEATKSWLALEGEVERLFSHDRTDDVAVRVTVPASAAPGRYTFTVKVVSVANPDEDFAESAAIAIDVAAAPPPPPPPPRKFPWWIVAVVVGVVVAGIVAWRLLAEPEPPKPVALGEPCEGLVCVAGLVCAKPPGGTLARCLGEGPATACASGSECTSGTCEGGRCMPLKPTLGQPCTGACADELVCAGGTCREETLGASCSGDTCLPGQTCTRVEDRRLCLLADGQSCRTDVLCASLRCVNGNCAATQGCRDHVDCGDGGRCVDGRCIRCGPGLSACRAGFKCVHGACVPKFEHLPAIERSLLERRFKALKDLSLEAPPGP